MAVNCPHPHPGPPMPPPPKPYNYSPDRNLPTIPGVATQIINGVKYKVYYETDWHQVLTEDGVPLCDLLRELPILDKTNFYRYKGVLRNMPGLPAIEQLYAMTKHDVGDVYLVETSRVVDYKYVCEVYTWLGGAEGWVYQGTTNRKDAVKENLPTVLRLIPEEIGEPNQILVVSEDGSSIVWGDPIKDHNTDDHSHPDIRKMIEDIEIHTTGIKVFNDFIYAGNWTYNASNGYYEYIYQSEKIPNKSYFELTPVLDRKEMSRVISIAHMNPVYQIETPEEYPPYAILRSEHVPTMTIEVSVKVFQKIERLCCDEG